MAAPVSLPVHHTCQTAAATEDRPYMEGLHDTRASRNVCYNAVVDV